jgi:hypothetical protein
MSYATPRFGKFSRLVVPSLYWQIVDFHTIERKLQLRTEMEEVCVHLQRLELNVGAATRNGHRGGRVR